jgi:hypothetical protein
VYPKVSGQQTLVVEATQRVMPTKLTTLTHKIAIQLQRAVPFAVLAPGGQSGNFWLHPHISSSRENLKCRAPLSEDVLRDLRHGDTAPLILDFGTRR